MDGHTARIGPNSILRLIDALEAGPEQGRTREIFERAGLGHHLKNPPTAMVDERDVTTLHKVLRDTLGLERARALGRDAGRRTGDYLLANRIPRFAQIILRLLPSPIASRLLLKAITRNAWTFAGSARFEATPGRIPRVSFTGCSVCAGYSSTEPLCDYYGGTIERLFRELVSARARVTEVQCQATGHPACVFEIDQRA